MSKTNNQNLIIKMMKEIDQASKKRFEEFQSQIKKDFKKIRKKYGRLLKFGGGSINENN
ncbi:hypothetical protein KAI04_04275 [Candidatus Pacearchaeota archaeon]|nr:hypothetical protein [Candidatus Pacearchaeota archaeon]